MITLINSVNDIKLRCLIQRCLEKYVNEMSQKYFIDRVSQTLRNKIDQ